jgi:hypothetical protein
MLPEQYDDISCTTCGNWHPPDYGAVYEDGFICFNCNPEPLYEDIEE